MMGTKRATLLLMFCAATVNNSYSDSRRMAPPAEQEAASSTQIPALNFEFFKTKVQPIFLKNRGEHARCRIWSTLSRASSNRFRLVNR